MAHAAGITSGQGPPTTSAAARQRTGRNRFPPGEKTVTGRFQHLSLKPCGEREILVQGSVYRLFPVRQISLQVKFMHWSHPFVAE